MTHSHIEKTLMHVTQEENMACKLKKAIYGVKQRSRDCFDKFGRIISEVGFEKCYFSTSDHSIFINKTSPGTVILIAHVDDILPRGGNVI